MMFARGCSAGDVYKLWRIFNSLAQTTDDGDCDEASVPVTVHAEEVQLFVQRLGVVLRTAATFDAEGRACCFADFLRAVETSCVAGKNASVVSSAVGELYDEIIANVLKKVIYCLRSTVATVQLQVTVGLLV